MNGFPLLYLSNQGILKLDRLDRCLFISISFPVKRSSFISTFFQDGESDSSSFFTRFSSKTAERNWLFSCLLSPNLAT